MSSYFRRGCFFALRKLVAFDLIQTSLYLYRSAAWSMSLAVNRPLLVRAITPRGFITLRYSVNRISRLMMESHLFWVVP